MSRSDRRLQDREEQQKRKREIKLEKWFKGLSKDQKVLIEEMAKIESKKAIERAGDYLNHSITAAATLVFEDKSLKEINKMFDLSAAMFTESTEKEKELKNEFGGTYMSKLKDLEKELILESTKLIKNKVKQSEAIKELIFKFPKLSKAQITNCYKKVKEDITPLLNNKIEPKTTKVVDDKVESKKIEEVKEPENKEEIKDMEVKKVSSLKIKNIKLEVEGNNGTYIAEKGTVKLDKNNWTREEWEAYKAEVDEVFKMINS